MTTGEGVRVARRHPFSAYLWAVLAEVAMLVWAWQVAGTRAGAHQNPIWLLVSSAGFVAVLVPHVLLHELGHLVLALVLRAPVLGVRVFDVQAGKLRRSIPGTSGHVLIDVARMQGRAPIRMILILVAGPVANLLAAGATATVAVDGSQPLTLRYLAIGATVCGALLAVSNLMPATFRGGTANDGRKALAWVRSPQAERARIQLAIDLANLRQVANTTALVSTSHDHERLLEAALDPRPEMARAGAVELLRWRPRHDGWQDVPAVATFAARQDIPAEVRARVSGSYAMSLAVARLRSRPPGQIVDPTAERVRWIVRLAELTQAADPRALSTRTARGLAELVAGRPVQARDLLLDLDLTASDEEQARASAVRGLAETELGDLDQAIRLDSHARRLAPAEPLVALLDSVIAARLSD